ncbi:MAG: glycosyltransferase family 2 protein [Candidatus Nanohaloarchaea archaeon]
MEVETAEENTVLSGSFARSAAVSAALVLFMLAPQVLLDDYVRGVNTVLLLFLLLLVGREYLSTLFSLGTAEPPEDMPEEKPEVSILIPAYNEEKVLRGTIEACADLDYPRTRMEAIVCYEADSTDDTAKIAEEAADEFDFVKAVERDEPGGGKAKATNYALQYAEGDIIASIDADHRFKEDALDRAVRWFHSDDEIWCVKGRCYGENAHDSLLALHATVERHIAERIDIFARHVFNGFTFFGGGQAFFRSEVFDELGEFDEEILVEDIDMSMKIHEHGKEIAVDHEIITYEENPAALDAWWSQRKRWSRGWMQVADRYLPALVKGDTSMDTGQRLDAIYTFGYAVIPAFMVLLLPIFLIQQFGVNTGVFLPYGSYLWTLMGLTPAVLSYTIFGLDHRQGESHQFLEYFAAFSLWIYFFLQGVVHIISFVEEFLLDRPSVYVTTSRAE